MADWVPEYQQLFGGCLTITLYTKYVIIEKNLKNNEKKNISYTINGSDNKTIFEYKTVST